MKWSTKQVLYRGQVQLRALLWCESPNDDEVCPVCCMWARGISSCKLLLQPHTTGNGAEPPPLPPALPAACALSRERKGAQQCPTAPRTLQGPLLPAPAPELHSPRETGTNSRGLRESVGKSYSKKVRQRFFSQQHNEMPSKSPSFLHLEYLML